MNIAAQKKEMDQTPPQNNKSIIKSNNEGTPKSINTVINPSKISAGKNNQNISNNSAMNGSICDNS